MKKDAHRSSKSRSAAPRIFRYTGKTGGIMKRISVLSTLLLLSTIGAGLSACSLVTQRSPRSGYADRDGFNETGLGYRDDRMAYTRGLVLEELGYDGGNSSINETQEAALTLRLQLKEAEKTLVGRKEREQYFRHKPLLQNDRERLEFIRLGSYETRARWLAARGISAANPKHPPEIQRLIEENDITLGMTRQAVKESWGEPESVEVVGNPIYGNERWRYLEQLSSPEGYQTQKRLIYFESGLVVGWQRQ
jgi:hypothetical protein